MKKRGAFTLIELIVVVALLACFALLLVPALGHVQPGTQGVQCLNNHRQMTRAWRMYADDNNGRIVSAYPRYGGFAGTWCDGNAETGGGAGSYTYGGADPAGIQHGLLWPYARALSLYHCPTDHRTATGAGVPFSGKPILRSVSMNSFMDGTSFGASVTWIVTNPNSTQDPNYPVYTKESEMRLPSQTFVLVDEDQESINDGMFLMDVGGTARFLDLPSRAHRFGYGICFADGRAEIDQFKDVTSKTWRVSDPRPKGGLNDWMKLRSVTTHPL